VAPSGQESVEPSPWPCRQLRPSQQSAEVEQACETSEQVWGIWQTPSRHSSVGPLQQGTASEQACPVSAHSEVESTQVPLVAPAGMSQVNPAQQSAFTVQLPPSPTQAAAPQVPSVHAPEQHSSASEQERPSSLQPEGWVPQVEVAVSQMPVQHSEPVVQLAGSVQAGSAETQ
jgi:hypothetical protein